MEYKEAIKDFREALRLGHRNAGNWQFWATDRLGQEVGEQGKPVDGLLITWTNILI